MQTNIKSYVLAVLVIAVFVVLSFQISEATTIGTNIITGAITGSGTLTLDLAGNENLAVTNTSASGAAVVSVTGKSSDQSGIQSIFTLDNNTVADTVGAVEANVTSANTSDADYLSGLLVENLTSADSTVNEFGIYQRGTNWDYGLFSEDAVLSFLPAIGSFKIIGSSASNETALTTADADRTDTTPVFLVDGRG